MLTARATAAELPHLAAMGAEHDLLDPLLDAVAQGFRTLVELVEAAQVEPALHARRLLGEQVATAREVLGAHLDHEEREAIAIIQRHLTQAEWADIEQRHFQRRPAPAGVGFLVSWFLEGVPREQVGTVVSSVGAPVRVIWALRRGAFRRGERRAFGAATDGSKEATSHE